MIVKHVYFAFGLYPVSVFGSQLYKNVDFCVFVNLNFIIYNIYIYIYTQ